MNLLYEVTDAVCRITLNRPEVYNALSPELISELTEAVQEAGRDERVRVIVLTGSGEKAFCSGADLKIGIGKASGMGDVLRERYIPLIMAMRYISKPVIGRLNGVAVGAGCSLALACDVLVAHPSASMAQLFVHIGLIPDAGSLFFLPRLVGPRKAFELASTGRTVPAAECLSLGLVNEVAEDLDAAVNRWVAHYAQAPTKAIGSIKQLMNESFSSDLKTMLNKEAEAQDTIGRTADAQEGIGAFLQKRKPSFKGI